MSLLSLSSDSLTRIFECLGDRASTITMLRRTCHQMNDLARKGNFHKVNAKYIEICGPGEESEDQFLYVFICRKKPQDELDFMWDQKTADFKQYRKKTEYFKLPTYMESYGIDGNFTYWCEEDELKQLKQDFIDKTKPMLLRGLEKVKSIEELHFCNFIVSDDFVGILMNLSEHFSSLRHVKITHNYHQSFPGMEAGSEQITNLLQIGPVESIHFDSEILEGVRDEHIQGIRTVTLIGYNGYTECPGITDATINAWMEDGSQSIYFEDIRTSITFKTLWRVILLIIDEKIGDCKYSFGALRERTADDIKILSEAQKARGIKWSSTTNSIDGEQLNTIHQLVVDDTVGKLTFTFNL